MIIGEVFSEVQEITEWMTLGVHLNLELPQLKRIELMHSDPKRHLLDMLDTWLNTMPEASWSDIVRALRKMEQNVLAGNIEAKFINTTTNGTYNCLCNINLAAGGFQLIRVYVPCIHSCLQRKLTSAFQNAHGSVSQKNVLTVMVQLHVCRV